MHLTRKQLAPKSVNLLWNRVGVIQRKRKRGWGENDWERKKERKEERKKEREDYVSNEKIYKRQWDFSRKFN